MSDRGTVEAYKLRQELGFAPGDYVNLLEVAQKLTIRVVHQDLGPGIEGACKCVGAKRLIVLKSNPSSPEKERFTLAHEVGHLLVHHNSFLCKSDDFYIYRTQNSDEQEANDFAAELLLPRRAALDILDKSGLSFSVIELAANRFCVSLSVAAITLTQQFQDNAAVIWHDGRKAKWVIKSEPCHFWIPGIVSSTVLAHRANDNERCILGRVDPAAWIGAEADNLICEEETHYFTELKNYLTILKLYYDS